MVMPILKNRRRWSTCRVGVIKGFLAGLIALLVTTTLRLYGGPLTPNEVLFDLVVAATPGRIESFFITVFKDTAKYLLLAVTTSVVLLIYLLLGAVLAERLMKGSVASRRALLFLIGGVPFIVGALIRLEFPGAILGQLVWSFGILQLSFMAVFSVLSWESLSPPFVDTGASVSRRAFLSLTIHGILIIGSGTLVAASASRLLPRRNRLPLDSGDLRSRADVEGLFRRPELGALGAGEVTPILRFYRVSKNAIDPELSADAWRLRIGGMVAQPMEFRLDDLERLQQVERYETLICISNEIGGGLIGNANWTGVPLIDILRMAGFSSRTRYVVFQCADGYVESISLDQARDTLLAYRMNGSVLEPRHGFPLRALVPGTYGMKNPKWITRIDSTVVQAQGFWNRLGWNAGAPIKTCSRVDAPSAKAVVARNTVVGGIAFAGDRGISRVEVSDDGGKIWRPAEIRRGLSRNSWVLWGAIWSFTGTGDQTLMVRATDGYGDVQTPEIRDPFPSGASGYHRIPVVVRDSTR